MRKFIQDILRDKGSTKYSITKTIAIIMTIILTSYITFVTYKGGEYDQFLIGQMIVMILTLTGFKNNFGMSKVEKKGSTGTMLDFKSEPSVKDEGSF